MIGSNNQSGSRGRHSKQTDIFRKMEQKATADLMRQMQQVLNRTDATQNDYAKWKPIQSKQKSIIYHPRQKNMKMSTVARDYAQSTRSKRENTINTKHPCFRYFQHSQLIEKDSHNLADLTKRIKNCLNSSSKMLRILRQWLQKSIA